MSRSFTVFSGSNERAVIAFLRALEACGHRACIVARTPADPILKTRYIRDVVHVRETNTLDVKIFKQCIDVVRSRAGDDELVVLPSSEYFNQFLLQHREEIEAMHCRIPLPRSDIYHELTEKKSSTRFFIGRGFHAPRTHDHIRKELLPAVAKPFKNIGPDGDILYPIILKSEENLNKFLSSRNIENYFFQDFITGESHYLLFYVGRHDETVTWSQRNLMQQPFGKSVLLAAPSTFHQTECATSMIDALRDRGYTGPGMIEVIGDGNRWHFIEMNPRIWGPIQLTLDQHVPILQAFIDSSLHDEPSVPHADEAGPRNRRNMYAWLGGMAATAAGATAADWHAPKVPVLRLLRTAIRNDVYLRADTWRLFIHELLSALRQSKNRERT